MLHLDRSESFWEYLGRVLGTEDWELQGERWQDNQYKPQVEQARNILVASIPGSENWLRWDEHDPRPLIADIVGALAWGASEDKSPKPLKYDPKDIRLHMEEAAFGDILYQKPPRGAITFLWTIQNWNDPGYEDLFSLPERPGQRLVMFVREHHYGSDFSENQEQDAYDDMLGGGALGFIRDAGVDLYPFPKDWPGIVERVYHAAHKMTARERALKELPHELKALVETLGCWETVNTALQALRKE